MDPEYQKFGKEIDPKTRKTPECEKFEHNLSRKSRLDTNYKLNEQNMNKRRRLDPDYQKFGKEIDPKTRKTPECEKFEHNLSRKSRLDPNYKLNEQNMNKRRRLDPDYQKFGKEIDPKTRKTPECEKFEHNLSRKSRLDPNYKLNEQNMNKRRRLDPDYQKFGKEIDPKTRKTPECEKFEHNLSRKSRLDPNYKLNEQNMNKRRRLDPDYQKFGKEIDPKTRKTPECEKFEHNLSRKSRLDPNYKLNEQNMNKRRRLDPEYQKFGKEIDPKTRKTSECEKFEHNLSRKNRLDPNYKLNKQNMNKRRRLDPEYQKFDKEIDPKTRKSPECEKFQHNFSIKNRLDPNYKLNEQNMNKRRRLDPEFQKFEKHINLKRRKTSEFEKFEKNLNRKRRLDPNYKLNEQNLNKRRRLDPEFQKFEKQINQKRRLDPDFQKFENEINKKRRKKNGFQIFERNLNEKRRLDQKYKLNEQSINQKRRMDPDVRQCEKDINEKRRNTSEFEQFETNINSKRRCDPKFKQYQKDIKCRKRSNVEYKHEERKKDKIRKQKKPSITSKSLDDLVSEFKSLVSLSCEYICTSCKQLWFKESVVPVSRVKDVDKALLSKCITGVTSFEGKEWLCHTCANSMLNNRLPALSSANYTSFAPRPAELELNQLEERLVSPINTFFQLRELPSGRQTAIRGNVVNVPADNISTVKALPRHIPDSQTIPVKLKKRLRYKSHYMYENIRPLKCIEATNYLLQKCLFRQYVPNGLDESWLSTHISQMRSTHWNEFLEPSSTEVKETQSSIATDNEEGKAGQKSQENADNGDIDSDWSEVDQNEPYGTLDTMMYPQNIDDQQNVLSLAPSEGNVPISTFQNDVEELSFPSLFCGERRIRNKDRIIPLKYSEICKLELRHCDRRFAKCITNIFFKCKKLQMKQIQDKAWLSIRRKKTGGKTYTAGEVRKEEVVDSMLKVDDGYKIFRTLRGSPPYWEVTKKDLFAMIRQLGLPTWFISLSAAETHWADLLISLGKLVDNVGYTKEQVANFTWETKNRLIRSDPVTVTRYFDHRVKKFFWNFLQSSCEPLGRIKEFFYRIEIQQRGSPHIHGILWVDEAPKYEVDSVKKIQDYIDKFITCERHIPGDDADLGKVQCHRHTHTCRKKGRVCRFNFPLPPMRCTQILEPLPIDMTEADKKSHRERWTKIKKELDKPDTQIMDFGNFIKHLNVLEEEYLLAVRSTLVGPKVFLRRKPSNVRVNGYNATVLRSWQANMDIQFITNAYACVMYIVNYVSKGQRGMSDLLRRACDEAKKGSSNIQDQVRVIGNKFLKHVEISAQEAIYLTLQMPLKHSSCAHAFINTSPQDERPFILKSADQLASLPADSEDIQCSNNVKRYSKRPVEAHGMCLVDFIAWYDIKKSTYRKKSKVLNETTELPESDSDDNKEDEPYDSDQYEECDKYANELRISKSVIMKRRKKRKVIRYVRYSEEKDPDNFYRENLMLFYPYVAEDSIIGSCKTYKERYLMVKGKLEKKRQEYNRHADEVDLGEKQMQQDLSEDRFGDIAPCTHHINEINREKSKMQDNRVEGEDLFTSYDIGSDLQLKGGTDMQEEKICNRLSDFEFRELARSLNIKQREFFYHVLKKVKTTDQQLTLFLSGGAGVGKTRVTKCLYQALLRYYNTGPGTDPEKTKVLLTAPTGKAAYLIKGYTLHSAFCIPANQGFNYKPLTHDKLNTLRCQLGDLKVLFIDEISMVGNRMFSFINKRLQEIMGLSKRFGGVNIIAIGDLFQLKPVMDAWVFKNTSVGGPEILAPNVWKENFEMFELSDIVRQKDDMPYAALLNRLREGNQTKEDIDLLKTRVLTRNNPNYPTDVTHLMYHNRNVDLYNSEIYNSAMTDRVSLASNDIAIGDITDDVKEQVLYLAREKEMGLSKLCKLALELQCDVTVNLDTQDGLVNGAGCVVKYFQRNSRGDVETVWVLFETEEIGIKLRSQCQRPVQCKGDSWTPIKAVTREFSVGRFKGVKVARKQFPLQLSCAKTIHRAQGSTLSAAIVQLPDRRADHLHYVAFSRVPSLHHINILDSLNPSKIRVSDDVKREMERLRTSATIALCYTPLYNLPQDSLKITFHNCQSLNLHKKDIQAEENLKASDINIFVETKLCNSDSTDNYITEEFEVSRSDFSTNRTAYGSAVYHKKSLNCKVSPCNVGTVEMTCVKFSSHIRNLHVVGIYCRPKEKWININKALTHLRTLVDPKEPLIIMGDFNIDILKNTSKKQKLVDIMESAFFCKQQINEFTTNGNTIIDLIFTNIEGNNTDTGVLESYFSYHKVIYIAVKQ